MPWSCSVRGSKPVISSSLEAQGPGKRPFSSQRASRETFLCQDRRPLCWVCTKVTWSPERTILVFFFPSAFLVLIKVGHLRFWEGFGTLLNQVSATEDVVQGQRNLPDTCSWQLSFTTSSTQAEKNAMDAFACDPGAFSWEPRPKWEFQERRFTSIFNSSSYLSTS